MNRCIRLLPFFIGVLVLGACSQIKGYRIDGSAPLPEFEGKMVYMKDVSTDAPVDSARITNGKFAFADTTKIENPVIKILSIHASKMGLEYRLPVVIENGTIKASIFMTGFSIFVVSAKANFPFIILALSTGASVETSFM